MLNLPLTLLNKPLANYYYNIKNGLLCNFKYWIQ